MRPFSKHGMQKKMNGFTDEARHPILARPEMEDPTVAAQKAVARISSVLKARRQQEFKMTDNG